MNRFIRKKLYEWLYNSSIVSASCIVKRRHNICLHVIDPKDGRFETISSFTEYDTVFLTHANIKYGR